MRLLLCDDHALVRDGLRLALDDVAESVEILEADGFEAACELARRETALDLVLLDLQMPGVSGLDGVRHFREAFPALPLAVVSANEDAGTIRAAIDLGAAGFIPKSLGREPLVAAVRLVLSGGVFVPEAALSPDAAASPEALGEHRRRRAAGLTGRQREVLALMARGLTNREICGVLEIAENTVKTHVKAILEALDASNRTEASVLARELDLRGPGEE